MSDVSINLNWSYLKAVGAGLLISGFMLLLLQDALLPLSHESAFYPRS